MAHWVSHSRDVLEASELLRARMFFEAAAEPASVHPLWGDPTKTRFGSTQA